MLRKGAVDLSGRVPFKSPSFPSDAFPTHVFRNFAIVKDGLVNVDNLVVTVSPATEKKLEALNVYLLVDRPRSTPTARLLIIPLSMFPVMNIRDSETRRSAMETIHEQVALTRLRARQKVVKFYADLAGVDEGPPAGFAALYGDETATWLKEQGFDPKNGYAPTKTKQAEPTGDYYLAKVIEVSMKGLNDLPSVNEVNKRRIAGKDQTSSGALMLPHVEEMRTLLKPFLDPQTDAIATPVSAAVKATLKAAKQSAVKNTRDAIRAMARKKFAMIVGGTWFFDAPTFGEFEGLVGWYGKDMSVKITAVETKVIL